ncbi:uncharacterized protein BDV17DRAFT_72143 [Aspergillus undulatus]|uniref:uncharacterized protein n=1 Tax=Aspergillus undulatus TaxID=1810928 RepID=UPI003CCE49CB
MVNQRLMRVPPPSPPQSNDGDISSGVAHHDDLYPGLTNDVSFTEQDSLNIVSNLQYAPTSDYPQNPALQHPTFANDVRVDTPPTDDGYQSTTSWQSPSGRPLTRARVLRSPRQRRRAKGNQSDWGFIMDQPLSVLTRDMAHVPIKDMERHVNRPIEERLKETAKKGKVPRPMNSFMLYRSAYADRTKEYFRQQNHQVVSTAAGQSWNKEKPEIRQKYEALATIEKKNHLRAHPGYKFTPAKDKRKRFGLDDDRYYGAGYRSTPEGSPAPHVINRISTYSTPEISSNGWDSSHPTPPDMNDHGLQPTDGYLASWPQGYPGTPTSGLMITSDPSQYVPTPNPDEMHYPQSTALAGLPGAAHQDLLGPQGQMMGLGAGTDEQVDPRILESYGSMAAAAGNQVYSPGYPSSWQDQAAANNTYLPYRGSVAASPNPYVGAPALQSGVQTLDPSEHWSSQAHSLDHPAGSSFDEILGDGQGY